MSHTENVEATNREDEHARTILTPFSSRHAFVASTLVAAAEECHGDPEPMIARLRALSPDRLPLPTSSTLQLWELLARVAAVDLTAARTLEPHLDAQAILVQAGIDPPHGLAWGVFAAEGGAAPVHARASTSNIAPDWQLWGTKPWCSLARRLDRALVTAHVDGGRRLFSVDLAQDAVAPVDEEWSSRGLAGVVSTPVRFDGASATPVGATDWHLDRRGFTWGAVGVAACWLGGAVGLFRDLKQAMTEKEPDQLALTWLGAARRHVRAGVAVMTHAAGLIDRGEIVWARALEIRGTIVEHCQEVLRICADALGPSALAFDEDHARRVADLGMYVQQHHAGRDDAEIGRAVVRASQRAFSHRDDGTSAAEWRSAGLLSREPFDLDELVDGNGRIIVVAAHPDDETLGAGGLIARAVRSGRDVRAVLCTDGEASHPDSPTHTPEQLAVRRRAEFAQALSRLGLGFDGDAAGADPEDGNPLTFLGLPDGRLAEPTVTIAEAVRALATHGCCVVAPLRDDGHSDHEAAGVAASEVAVDRDAVLVEYPIWYWHWASPAAAARWRTLRVFPLDETTHTVKCSALDEYISQSRPLSPAPSDAAVLTERFLEHFTGRIEPFRVSRPGRGGAGDARSTFNTVYRESDDPWRAGSAYERRKRAILLASLPRARYDSALELGCGQGHLSDALAERCATLVAFDASGVAVEAARRRLGDVSSVRFDVALIPYKWPRIDEVDLVVMSEMGYFLSERELDDTLTRIEQASRAGAHVVLCHWLHEIDGWSLDGTTVHHRARHRDWRNVVRHVDDDFVLDVFEVHAALPDRGPAS